jgi:hypothetical protein
VAVDAQLLRHAAHGASLGRQQHDLRPPHQARRTGGAADPLGQPGTALRGEVDGAWGLGTWPARTSQLSSALTIPEPLYPSPTGASIMRSGTKRDTAEREALADEPSDAEEYPPTTIARLAIDMGVRDLAEHHDQYAHGRLPDESSGA